MSLKDLLDGLRRGDKRVRVVAESPRKRLLILALIGSGMMLAAAGGFFLGKGKARLDRTYVAALEQLDRINSAQIADLKSQLVDLELAREVDGLAAQRLRSDIKALRDKSALLAEEVTFYKSLMAPSKVVRGLQIAAFELVAGGRAGEYGFHMLLTQVEARREWVQGEVRMEVHGSLGGNGSTKPEQTVLALTELAEIDPYPLKFRFRYFQDLTGSLKLPAGFVPESVEVTVSGHGSRSDSLQQTFDWTVRE